MSKEYALDIWESVGPCCPTCRTMIPTGGAWKRLGIRKTRRGIVSLANKKLSTGYSYRIQCKGPQGEWRNDSMRGVKGYGEY